MKLWMNGLERNGIISMNKIYLMECGHVAQAQDRERKPVCAICLGTRNDSKSRIVRKEIDLDKPGSEREGLEGRKARCSDCGKVVDSSWNLPFFAYNPEREYDSFYDGCYGWN